MADLTSMVGKKLVDYSYAHPSPRMIVRGGYVGVMRYLSFDGPPKNLTRAERDALHAVGLGIGLVWETTANEALDGYSRGRKVGEWASQQAEDLAFPPHLPLFYAVDFEPTRATMPRIIEFFRGINETSRYPVGAYGNYTTIEHVAEAGVAKWFWQCTAWSYNHRSPRAHFFQRYGGVLENTCDENDILQPPDWLWFAGESEADVTPEQWAKGMEELKLNLVQLATNTAEESARRTVYLLANPQGDAEPTFFNNTGQAVNLATVVDQLAYLAEQLRILTTSTPPSNTPSPPPPPNAPPPPPPAS